MPQPPANEPFSFDRSNLNRPRKKAKSPVLVIVLSVLGVAFLICAACAGVFLHGVYQGYQQAKNRAADDADPNDRGKAAFQAASLKIVSGSDGKGAWGNTEEARQLAEKFSIDIKTVREAFFTKRKKKPVLSLTDGAFLTYCHLDERACVFLVHVPDLRKFTKEAKADLADLAWATAQDVVRSNVDDPPPQLAIATRGVLFYDTVLLGSFQPDEESEEDGITQRESEAGREEFLYRFFEPVKISPTPLGVGAPDADEMKGLVDEAPPSDESEKPPDDTPQDSEKE